MSSKHSPFTLSYKIATVPFATFKASRALPILQEYQQANYSCDALTFDGDYHKSPNFCLQQKVKLFVLDMYDFFDNYDADYLLSQNDKLQEAINRFEYCFNQLSTSSESKPFWSSQLKLPEDVLFVLKAAYLRSREVKRNNLRPLSKLLSNCYPTQQEAVYNLFNDSTVLCNSKKQWEKVTNNNLPYDLFDSSVDIMKCNKVTENESSKFNKPIPGVATITVDMLKEDIIWFKVLSSLYTKDELLSDQFYIEQDYNYKKFLVDHYEALANDIVTNKKQLTNNNDIDLYYPNIDTELLWRCHLFNRDVYGQCHTKVFGVNIPLYHEPMADCKQQTNNNNTNNSCLFVPSKMIAQQLTNNWSVTTHAAFPLLFKKTTLTILLLNRTKSIASASTSNNTVLLPTEMILQIICTLAKIDAGFPTQKAKCANHFAE